VKSSPALATTATTDSRRRLKLWIRMIRATRRIENELRDRLRREFDETMPRFDVMAALYRQPEGIKMSELSRSLMVSNGNVTPIVEKLVQAGMVNRTQPPDDRRSLLVSLSDEGANYFNNMASRHQCWVDELFGALGEQDIDLLNQQFDRLSQ